MNFSTPWLAIFLFLVFLPYTGLLIYLIIGIKKLQNLSPESSTPFASIVVPLRNEGQHVKATLNALLQQDYKGKFEIICVEDRSTDDTWEQLCALAAEQEKISLVRILSTEGSVTSPKKRALDRGIAQSRGEIILTTDADCLPPPNWLSSMLSCLTPQTGIVQGPKHILSSSKIIDRYQSIEVFGLVCVEAASFAWGKPLLASAPSLAYRKSLFQEVQGFDGLMDLVSGDDDMLVHKMTAQGRYGVAYNANPQASVGTHPAHTWKEVLIQRSRWSSNGTRYPSLPYVLLLVGLYMFYLCLPASLILTFCGAITWHIALAFWLTKFTLDFTLLTLGAKKLGFKGLKDAWWATLIHVPLVITAVPLGILGLYGWKK